MSYGDVTPKCWCGQDWILPRKVILAVLGVSLLLLLIGVILLAVGLTVGGVLTGLGGCGLLVLLLLCIHAYCCRYTRDAFTQTGVQIETDDIPNYAVIQKPSSLKRSDSGGSKRNGRTLEKHVTLAPDIEARERSGQVTVAPSSGMVQMDGVHQIPIQQSSQSQMHSQQNNYAQQTPIYKPSGQMYVPPAPMNRQVGPTYAPPPSQYPMQVYPVRSASSTSSTIRYGFDDDYDNPAETTPMLGQHSPQISSGMSSASYSSQFRSASSSHQTTIACKGGMQQHSQDFDLPEPQPLQYPSAKRPMTFEQTSSSKMSVYDNVGGGFSETGVA